MSDALIKPLRAYEDRGTIRDVHNEPYAAPIWLAKELEQLKLCRIVSGDGSEQASEMKLSKKGKRWIIVDADDGQVGDFIGGREEVEGELARLLAATSPASAETPAAAAGEQPAAGQPISGQPNDPPPQE
jgi:2-keto-4-pentenoate hydratase